MSGNSQLHLSAMYAHTRSLSLTHTHTGIAGNGGSGICKKSSWDHSGGGEGECEGWEVGGR